MTLSEARWLSKCTVAERATDTEAALSLCAKCAGKDGAKLGCVKGSTSSQILALGQGSLHPHPQPPHGPAIWEELLLLQQLLETTRRAGNMLRQPTGIRSASQREYAPPANGNMLRQQTGGAGLQHPVRGAMCSCPSPTVSSGCWAVRQLTGWWISVDLSNFLQQSVLTKGLCQAV